MKVPNLIKLFFPLKSGLMLGVESHRDGTAVEWCEGIPLHARYYLTDELETPLLDPSCCYFHTASEVLMIAEVYQKLVDAKHPCPDRSFHDVYAYYGQLLRRLPQFCLEFCDPELKGMPAIKKFLNES